MKELSIDLLTLSAHKFCGPRGIGVLYARQGTPLQPLIFGGSQERGKRAGTENLPAIAGMAAAFRDACANMEKNFAHLTALGSHLIEELSLIPGSLLNGSRMRRLPGNVNFSFEGIDGEMLLLLLDQQGIAASLGSACASGSLNPSHVLLALGRSPELAKSLAASDSRRGKYRAGSEPDHIRSQRNRCPAPEYFINEERKSPNV